MWRWVARIFGFALGAVVLAATLVVVGFFFWRSDIERGLAANSTIARTARGPIEYAELGQGPAVLMIHGTPGGYDGAFGFLKVTHAERNGFRYIMPSRPGYLRTPLSVGRTPAEQADALAALLDTLKVPRTAVIAESGGGPAGLQFALRHPDRCSALILESALIRNYAGPPANMPKSAFGGGLRDFQIYVADDIAIPLIQAVRHADPQLMALFRTGLRSVAPYSLRKAGMENDLDQETRLDGWPLSRITCPTLILQGGADQSVPRSDAEFAHGQIANSKLIELPGQDHTMMYVKHDQLNAAMSAFIRAHP